MWLLENGVGNPLDRSFWRTTFVDSKTVYSLKNGCFWLEKSPKNLLKLGKILIFTQRSYSFFSIKMSVSWNFDSLIQKTDIHMSVGNFTHRVGCRRRSLVAKQHEILLIFFLDCKVDRPVVKSSKVLANLMKNNFFTRVRIFDANLLRHRLCNINTSQQQKE